MWFPNRFTFLFQIQAFLLTFFSGDPNILRPFHGLSTKQRSPIRGLQKNLYRVHVATSLHCNSSSERDCVRELHCLAPDGRPALSLVVSEEYFKSKLEFYEQRRTNKSKLMAHVYQSKHAIDWSPSLCTCIVTQIPV